MPSLLPLLLLSQNLAIEKDERSKLPLKLINFLLCSARTRRQPKQQQQRDRRICCRCRRIAKIKLCLCMCAMACNERFESHSCRIELPLDVGGGGLWVLIYETSSEFGRAISPMTPTTTLRHTFFFHFLAPFSLALSDSRETSTKENEKGGEEGEKEKAEEESKKKKDSKAWVSRREASSARQCIRLSSAWHRETSERVSERTRAKASIWLEQIQLNLSLEFVFLP